jgi:hypothetical protein
MTTKMILTLQSEQCDVQLQKTQELAARATSADGKTDS